MTCQTCGLCNDDGVFYCRGCRTMFVGDYADELPPPDEDERILLLAEACELVAGNEWSLSDFQHYVNEFTAEQHRREQGIRGVEIPFGLEVEFAEEQEVGYSGVDQCNRGLDILGSYDPETEGAHVLKDGLRYFYRGVSRVKEAMKINRRNYARPLWI